MHMFNTTSMETYTQHLLINSETRNACVHDHQGNASGGKDGEEEERADSKGGSEKEELPDLNPAPNKMHSPKAARVLVVDVVLLFRCMMPGAWCPVERGTNYDLEPTESKQCARRHRVCPKIKVLIVANFTMVSACKTMHIDVTNEHNIELQ